MEVENISKSMVFNYDLISNLIYQTNPNENEGNKNISVDILRKHYYDDILAAACKILEIDLTKNITFLNYYR